MDNINLENNQFIISNSNEKTLEETRNNCIEPIVSSGSIIKTNLSEKTFETILRNLKVEDNCDDDCSDFEDSEDITEKYTYNRDIKSAQQDKMCEAAVASSLNESQMNNETDIDDSKSNLQEFINTELFDSQITSIYRNSPSTSPYPMMQILKSNPSPHTCKKYCVWCNRPFLVLDNPNHIGKIRSIDKQNAFLKMQLSLNIDSCICDICWKFMEKNYKSIKPEKNKEISKNSIKYPVEYYMKKSGQRIKSQRRICSVHNCSKPYVHKLSVEQCKNIKQLLLSFEYCSFAFIEPKNSKNSEEFIKFPLCVCNYHLIIIDLLSTCQLCGDNLNEYFNTDDWLFYEQWNWTLVNNNIPLILQPGMFICVTCKKHISKPEVFPALDLERFRKHVKLRIAIRSKVYGPSEYNMFNICQGSTYYAESPDVIPKMIKEGRYSSKKITFSDPLLTATYHFEPDFDEDQSESLIITDKQNISYPKLDPKEEELYPIKHEVENNDDQFCSFYTDSLNQSFDSKPEVFDQNSSEGLTGILKTTKHVVSTNVDDNKSLDFNCQLYTHDNKMSNDKGNKPKITSVYSFRRPRRDNILSSTSKDLEKEVVNPTSLKRKNAIEDGKKLKNQRLIETQSSIENISTPKSHQNKSTNPVDSRF